ASSDNYAAIIAALAHDSVSVSRRDHRYARRAIGNKFSAVAHGRSSSDVAQGDNARSETEARFELHIFFDVGGNLGRLKTLMITVEDGAGTHHVRPGRFARTNSATVGHVDGARRNSRFAQLRQSCAEDFFLLLVLRGAKVVRGSEMREYAGQFKMRASGVFADERADFFGRNPE